MRVTKTLRDTKLTQPSLKHPLKETHTDDEIVALEEICNSLLFSSSDHSFLSLCPSNFRFIQCLYENLILLFIFFCTSFVSSHGSLYSNFLS